MNYSLNLDPLFSPTCFFDITFEHLTFSGGEQHIKIKTPLLSTDSVDITCRIKNGDDIMKVLLAKDALKQLEITDVRLIMPYIPYARQDRICASGEAFSLKVFADIINNANFKKVIVLDAHSDVAPALINNCVNLNNYHYVGLAIEDILGDYETMSSIILISPDSGANKKINKLADNINLIYGNFNSIVKCDKIRNVSDGSLSGFEVFTNDLRWKKCLIVDDICSRGGTFMGIAKALKEKNAGKIYLFVTHYEGVADIDKLKEAGIEHVFTTNSINNIESDFITQYQIKC